MCDYCSKNVFFNYRYKRAHEDCSNDSIDDQNCKKRCDDVDRHYVKMMSLTSSMSVLVPELSWSNSTKKRKSSRMFVIIFIYSIKFKLVG